MRIPTSKLAGPNSKSTLSEFYSWLRQKRRTERARERAEQAKQKWAKENPEASMEELARYGQFVFTSETIEDGNAKAFVALEKLRLAQKQLKNDQRRIAILEEKEKRAAEAKKTLEQIVSDGDGGLSVATIEKIEQAAGLL